MTDTEQLAEEPQAKDVAAHIQAPQVLIDERAFAILDWNPRPCDERAKLVLGSRIRPIADPRNHRQLVSSRRADHVDRLELALDDARAGGDSDVVIECRIAD